MAIRSAKAVAQVAMISVIVIYYITFTSVGISSMVVDRSLRQDNCGKTTHLWKYTMLNTVFAGVTLLTYGSFPGGGEGARARALMIAILHFGLGVWGLLLWSNLPECHAAIREHYQHIHFFHMVCVWHNLVFLMLYVSHELYLGERLGGDLTLIPEVRKHETADFSYHHADSQPLGETKSVLYSPNPTPPPSTIGPNVAPSSDVPPLLKGGGSGNEISKEYAVLQSREDTPTQVGTHADPRQQTTPQRGL